MEKYIKNKINIIYYDNRHSIKNYCSSIIRLQFAKHYENQYHPMIVSKDINGLISGELNLAYLIDDVLKQKDVQKIKYDAVLISGIELNLTSLDFVKEDLIKNYKSILQIKEILDSKNITLFFIIDCSSNSSLIINQVNKLNFLNNLDKRKKKESLINFIYESKEEFIIDNLNISNY